MNEIEHMHNEQSTTFYHISIERHAVIKNDDDDDVEITKNKNVNWNNSVDVRYMNVHIVFILRQNKQMNGGGQNETNEMSKKKYYYKINKQKLAMLREHTDCKMAQLRAYVCEWDYALHYITLH